MELVKNQHYVPQSYLKYFADSKEKIFVFDKVNEKIFPSNVRNIASERFFYDFPESLVDSLNESLPNKQVVEKFFSKHIEGEFSKLLNNIRARYTLSSDIYSIIAITKEEKSKLSILLTYQLLRTKEFRETMLKGQELFLQVLIDSIGVEEIEGYNIGDATVERNKQFDSIEHARLMFDSDMIKDFSLILYNHIWTIGVNVTNIPLYTSDNPFVKHGHNENEFLSNNGLASEGIEINFPISSNLILIIYDRKFFEELSYFYENRFIELFEENIKYANWLQVTSSNRQIYCKENNFTMIEDMKKKNKNILNNKTRWTAHANGKVYKK
ncbi:DUF4238 domain-containing protein [Lysinibacillus capsici]|uniref:DUF4238 domain-containing protein n=1 Tax=Lysinibacillus capsici TaxID=2115968 RepID=UPI0032E3C158